MGAPVGRLRHVYMSTKDPETLAAFYGDALGLEVRFADPAGWVQFRLDGTAFAVAGPGEAPDAQTGLTVPVFEVEDLDSWPSRLAAAGAEVDPELRDMGGHGRVLTARDPEGNVFQLFAKQRPE
jgi:predicted enzyme related to lactoylglutathione lyase